MNWTWQHLFEVTAVKKLFEFMMAYHNAFIKKLYCLQGKVNKMVQTNEYFTTDVIKSLKNQFIYSNPFANSFDNVVELK